MESKPTKTDSLIVKAVNKILTKEQKLQLKAEFEKYSIKMSEAMLADGTKIEIEGDVAPNSKVYIVSETGKVPAPDATHEVVNADGSITLVTTANGIITAVEPKKVEETEMSAEAKAKEEEEKKKAAEAQMQSVTMSKVSDVEVKLSAVEKENETLKAEVKSVKESVTVLLSAFDKLANTAVEEEQVKLSKSYEDMTPAERYRYNKGL